jgi:hypothetical protein
VTIEARTGCNVISAPTGPLRATRSIEVIHVSLQVVALSKHQETVVVLRRDEQTKTPTLFYGREIRSAAGSMQSLCKKYHVILADGGYVPAATEACQ